MIKEKVCYGYNDLTIIPSKISTVRHRKDCNPYLDNGNLPLFTAPMYSVVCKDNVEIYENNKINVILPRTKEINYEYLKSGKWIALSLDQFIDTFVENIREDIIECKSFKVCIDIANGHMKDLYEAINSAKQLSRQHDYSLEIMTGNIANSETYRWICMNSEVDYIRLSIGSGMACITSPQTGIHYPIASLIDECYKIKTELSESNILLYRSLPKLIADGGIHGYGDINKALALGADYVMVGSEFAACYDSAAKTIKNVSPIFNLSEQTKREIISRSNDAIEKIHFGMASKEAQRIYNEGATKFKTAEGTFKTLKCKHTITSWTNNFTDYLRSAMSYTNCKTLDDYIGKVDLVVNSNSEIFSVNK